MRSDGVADHRSQYTEVMAQVRETLATGPVQGYDGSSVCAESVRRCRAHELL